MQSGPVFLLDAATLPTALSKYLRALRLRFPRAPTLVLDAPQPREELCRLLLLGIQGFLAYSEVEEQLLPAVHAVADGRLWVAPIVLEEFARFSAQLSRARAMKGVPLTRKQKRILDLVQRRLSNKEIASILNISESTVKFHLGNIFLKLGVRDRQTIHNAAGNRPQQTLHPEKAH
jgi:DNA-binding NarL/FixJ family response regulator